MDAIEERANGLTSEIDLTDKSIYGATYEAAKVEEVNNPAIKSLTYSKTGIEAREPPSVSSIVINTNNDIEKVERSIKSPLLSKEEAGKNQIFFI